MSQPTDEQITRALDEVKGILWGSVQILASNHIRAAEERIEELERELRRCRVFITTREKMHPDGVALFDELLEAQEQGDE